MMEDRELLREYVASRSESAFTELVARHINLVYGTALRTVGEAQMAQDVAQGVFILLARRAHTVREGNALPGWLYRATYRAAANAVRSEQRRRQWEGEAVKRAELEGDSSAAWEALGPMLDEAMRRLSQTEQDAVVLRYFEGKSLRETGVALAMKEDAVQKRVSRALEKMRGHLARRGVTVATATLGEAITAQAAPAAPAGLAASVAGASLTAGASSGMAGVILKTLSMTMKIKTVLMAAIVIAAVAAIPITIQQREISRLRGQVEATRVAGGPRGSVSNAEATPHRLTQAEIEAKIQAIIKDPKNWKKAWTAFIKSLDPADYSRVVNYLEKLGLSTFTRNELFDILLPAWAKSDPQAAIAYAMKGSQTGAGGRVFSVVKSWLDEDPEAVATWWQHLPPGMLRVTLSEQVISTLADNDPQEAFNLMQGVESLAMNNQKQLTQGIFATWGESDPAAAVAQASAMPAGPLRSTAIQNLAFGWACQDPQAELVWANTLPNGSDKNQAVGDAISELALTDPNQTLEYVMSLPQGEERSDGIGRLAMGLAIDDPNAAWTFAQQLPDGKDKQDFLRMTTNVCAMTDPATTFALVETLPPTNVQAPSLLGSVGMSWGMDAPQDAIAALGNMTDGPGRDAFLYGVFNGTLKSSPADAEKIVSSLPADKQAAAEDQVTVALASTDPSVAAAWMASLPEGVTSTKAINTVVSNWAESDPVATGQWIQTLPAGTSQDTAIQSYVGAIADSDPSTAGAWAVNIGDPTKRNAAIETVAQSWLETDPSAATAWLAQTNLPDAQKQKLLAAPGVGGNAGK